jgi:hypothetical protein
MGQVSVRLADRSAGIYPGLATAPLAVFTGLHDRLVWATTLCEFVEAGSMDGLAVAGAERRSGNRSKNRQR